MNGVARAVQAGRLTRPQSPKPFIDEHGKPENPCTS
jgi:hypothetical protein